MYFKITEHRIENMLRNVASSYGHHDCTIKRDGDKAQDVLTVP